MGENWFLSEQSQVTWFHTSHETRTKEHSHQWGFTLERFVAASEGLCLGVLGVAALQRQAAWRQRVQ